MFISLRNDRRRVTRCLYNFTNIIGVRICSIARYDVRLNPVAALRTVILGFPFRTLLYTVLAKLVIHILSSISLYRTTAETYIMGIVIMLINRHLILNFRERMYLAFNVNHTATNLSIQIRITIVYELTKADDQLQLNTLQPIVEIARLSLPITSYTIGWI